MIYSSVRLVPGWPRSVTAQAQMRHEPIPYPRGPDPSQVDLHDPMMISSHQKPYRLDERRGPLRQEKARPGPRGRVLPPAGTFLAESHPGEADGSAHPVPSATPHAPSLPSPRLMQTVACPLGVHHSLGYRYITLRTSLARRQTAAVASTS